MSELSDKLKSLGVKVGAQEIKPPEKTALSPLTLEQVLGGGLRQAVLADDWAQVAGLSAQVAEKVQSVKLPQRHRLGTPWVGAWAKLRQGKVS